MSYSRTEAEESTTTTTTGVAFVLGVVVGMVVALLFAPQPGRQTRHDLERWAGQGKERLGDLKGKASDIAAKAGEAVDRAVEKGRSTVERGREFVRERRQRSSEDLGSGVGEHRQPGGPRHTG